MNVGILTLEEFRDRVVVIDGERADQIRAAYIARFVDTTSAYYRTRIATRRRFRDGDHYTGYLWDCLKQAELVPAAHIIKSDRRLDYLVWVFWDLHSKQQQMLPNYWKFPKAAVIEVLYRDLLAGLHHLPEDIYITDKGMTWTVILTHEYLDGDVRICLEAG
jgi:hypothetical protein